MYLRLSVKTNCRIFKELTRAFDRPHAMSHAQALRMTHDTREVSWWSQSGSNRRPSRCKRDALPAELWPRPFDGFARCRPKLNMVGLGGVEPPTSPLSGVRSNQLSYRPFPRKGQHPNGVGVGPAHKRAQPTKHSNR